MQSRKSFRRPLFISVFVTSLFVFLVVRACQVSSASKHSGHTHTSRPLLSNGTHLFGPTTILISLDGFRADFLNRNLTPALDAFIASGVSPLYMLPSFPSVTFPNHFTLVTGLYPESHGVVGNTFWDPELLEEFFYTDPGRSLQPKWWTAEPLWVTAEQQGVRTAIHMWPGSEAHIPPAEPTYLDKFNESEVLERKVGRLLHWLDLPGDGDGKTDPGADLRPQLMAAYVPNVDADGHLYGPNSTEIRSTISEVDSMLAMLVQGLSVRNLTEIVNLVIVSDHGMATTSTSRMIQLDDLVDLDLLDHVDGWPLRGLRLKHPERDLSKVYQELLERSKQSEGFDVYTHETMPERYHFTKNDRIAPLWIVPKTGWAIVKKSDFDIAAAREAGKAFHPIGLHGYDHEHPLMRAIFVARGPAFPQQPNSRVPIFQNVEVYNIVCDTLGIQPHPNNGTLYLPLKTEGLHRDDGTPSLDTAIDPVPDHVPTTEIRPGHMERPGQSKPAEWQTTSDQDDYSHRTNNNVNSQGDVQSSDQKTHPEDEAPTNWWDFVHRQSEAAKEWVHKIIEAFKNDTSGEQNHEKRGGYVSTLQKS